jgi:hypothetical protein
MRVIDIFNQLGTIYGQPTPAIFKMNDAIFHSLYSAVDAPEVLFHCIEECAKTVLLGCNPYTGRQPVTNASISSSPPGCTPGHPRNGIV